MSLFEFVEKRIVNLGDKMGCKFYFLRRLFEWKKPNLNYFFIDLNRKFNQVCIY